MVWTRDPEKRASDPELPSRDAALAAHRYLSSLEGYRPTRLSEVPALASDLDVSSVLWKHEAERWGVGSFKALGGAYATARVLGADPPRGTTVICATDGNHGRAVAWAAKALGCRAVVLLPKHAGDVREFRIRAMGADVRRVPGTYDDAVRRAADLARGHGWLLVSDTDDGEATDGAGFVIAAYTLIVEEIDRRLPPEVAPTHVFVQAGVGGLAAAVAWWAHERWGARRPRIVVVEPKAAACVASSLRRGRPTPLTGDLLTMADCLSAGRVSETAWPILRDVADHAIALQEAAIARAHRKTSTDPRLSQIRVGPSGSVGLAGAIQACGDDRLRDVFRITRESRVLLLGTEEPLG